MRIIGEINGEYVVSAEKMEITSIEVNERNGNIISFSLDGIPCENQVIVGKLVNAKKISMNKVGAKLPLNYIDKGDYIPDFVVKSGYTKLPMHIRMFYKEKWVDNSNRGMHEYECNGSFDYSLYKGKTTDVLDINHWIPRFCSDFSGILGGIRVDRLEWSQFKITGSNMKGLFKEFTTDELDLSCFDFSNIKVLDYLFCDSRIKNLDLSFVDFSNISSVEGMFFRSKIDHVDLSDIQEVGNLQAASYIFDGCNLANYIGHDEFISKMLSNPNRYWHNRLQLRRCYAHSIAESVEINPDSRADVSFNEAFYESEIKNIKIKGLSLSVYEMESMFSCCTSDFVLLEDIEGGGTDYSTVRDNTKYMFSMANIKHLKINNLRFKMNKMTMTEMFYGANIEILEITNLSVTNDQIGANGMFEKANIGELIIDSTVPSKIVNSCKPNKKTII